MPIMNITRKAAVHSGPQGQEAAESESQALRVTGVRGRIEEGIQNVSRRLSQRTVQTMNASQARVAYTMVSAVFSIAAMNYCSSSPAVQMMGGVNLIVLTLGLR